MGCTLSGVLMRGVGRKIGGKAEELRVDATL